MTVTVNIPSTLRHECDGLLAFELEATTVRNALERLELSRPALYRSVCYENGAVRQHVNLFVNSALVDKDRLDIEVKPGDNLFIMPAVSGG